MLKRIIMLMLFAASVGAVACKNNGAKPAGKASLPPEAELYQKYCVSCHGLDGKLQFGGCPDLTKSSLGREEVVERIAKGKGMMNGFGRLMSKEDIAAVADYVITFRK